MSFKHLFFLLTAVFLSACSTLADQMLSETPAETAVAELTSDAATAIAQPDGTTTPIISAAFTLVADPTATDLLLPTEVLGDAQDAAEVTTVPTETPVPDATEAPTEPPAVVAVAAQLPAPDTLTYTEVTAGFNRPIYVTHFGDGSNRLLIAEQHGALTIRNGDGSESVFMDISDRVTRDSNEQGLLGVAFPADYAETRAFYVHYSDDNGDTTVSRFQANADGSQGDAASETILLRESQPYGNHNGGSIAFGADGFLYIGLGDGGRAGDPLDAGQDPSTLLGSILRIEVSGPDYIIPASNPFGNEVWAYGIRNPWRFSFDRATGDIYIGDVGQNLYEEISYLPFGFAGDRNFGWRATEGFHCYEDGCDTSLYVPPIAEYDHSLGCSVTGGYVYRGEKYPSLNGVYLFGDYCTGVIWGSLQQPDGSWQTEVISRSGLNISSFGEDEAGELYVVHHQGGIYQIGLDE